MDHISISDQDIQAITKKGIQYPGGFIDFADCAARFSRMEGGSGHCVGESCGAADAPYVAFYTQALATRIVFRQGNRLKVLWRKTLPAIQRFHAMKSRLGEFGYTTYDIT